MFRVTHLIRLCEVRAMHSNATPSIQQLKEVFESMNIGEVTITKPLVTIVCPYVGQTVEDQRKIIIERLPEEFRSKVDVQIVLQEVVGEVTPVFLNKVEHPSEPRICATPQAHLDDAVYLLSRRQGSSASEQLWLSGSLALENLAKKGGLDPKSHQSKTLLVDYLTDRYESDAIFKNWRVLGDCHSNGYEDRKELFQVHRDLAPTVEFCNALYKIHKEQESVEKKAIASQDFEEWFKDKFKYMKNPLEKFYKLYSKVQI